MAIQMTTLTDHQLAKLHERCDLHFNELALHKVACCFYCIEAISFDKITEWTDCGLTAICPKCHVDAVLPGIYRVGILEQMHKRYFETHST
jgi:hypothetical protein